MYLTNLIARFVRKAYAELRSPLVRRSGGWAPILRVREPYTGAWQNNDELGGDSALSYFAVFACITLIAADVGKLTLRLVQQDDEGIWDEATNSAWSPVLRKPNRYQTTQKFIEQWITSKLVHGNAYVLKERDRVGLVRALYVLDPSKVVPLVAPDGAVYYELRRDDLAGLTASEAPTGTVVVPASEIIHDRMLVLFHPLCGVSPLFACGATALQGVVIQEMSRRFFAGGSHPGGVLLAPGAIDDKTAQRMKEYWQTEFSGDNVGKVAVLGDGLKYEPMTVTATDSQLIEQLRWTAETICACFHVAPFMIGIGPPPPFASVEPMLQLYHSQCIQTLLTACENSLDEGLGLIGTSYGTEFDTDDLIWMDTATKTKAAADAISSGAMAPNEARKKYFGLGSVEGGDTPYMQQQNYSLKALNERDQDKPFSKPQAAPTAVQAPAPSSAAAEDEAKRLPAAALAFALLHKDWYALGGGSRAD